LAQQIQDDGFHEIQLNGKQLVFLFMAATVVSVVIFLCGVLVGRGVRIERGATEATTIASAEPVPAPPAATTPPPPAGSDPTAAAPPASDDLSYFSRLEKANAPQEKLKPPTPEQKPATPARATAPREPAPREAASTAAKATPAKAAPAPTPPAAAPEPAPVPAREKSPVPDKAAAPEKAAAARVPEKGPPQPDLLPTPREPAPAPVEQEKIVSAEATVPPSGDGFAVQIAALNVRSEADAIAKRLSSKGYAAYVLSPADGAPGVYRVRVGKFPTRRQAESIAAKLQKEEQFKPWVTR